MVAEAGPVGDDGVVPPICPTCQTVFAGSLKASAALLLCMGLFSIFWLGGAPFTLQLPSGDDRRMACRAVARGPRPFAQVGLRRGNLTRFASEGMVGPADNAFHQQFNRLAHRW
jgi:hypothetical protein